ncbi:MAG: protein kinase, partial [Planctomycetaceae bacterium]|nr:protein kinase [Planctomycetaceae bacterium]
MAKFDTQCPDCQAVYTLDNQLQGKAGMCQFCRKTFLLDPIGPGSKGDNPPAPDEKTNVLATSTVFTDGLPDLNDTSFSLKPGVESDMPPQPDGVKHAALANSGQTTKQPGTKNPDTASDAAAWKVGDVILGVYEVRAMPNGQPYAEGGVGLVHRVYHREWDIELAVKSPKSNIFQTEVGRQNYERECKTWIDLGLHPHIVTCYLARRIDGIPRLFAELVLDGSLNDWVKSGRLYQGTLDEIHKRIFDIAIQFSWGLDYAHRQGLLHLDIKPANVMMSGNAVKVTDFGLSRAVAAAAGDSDRVLPENAGLRWEGMTPGYCSPEQYQSYLLYQSGDKVQAPPMTAQSDIWSWAISVMAMYYGRPPCKKGGQTAGKTFEQFLKLPPSPGKPLMPETVTELLRHCFQWEPEQRPRSMAEISARLIEAWRDVFQEPYFRRPPIMTASTTESLNNRAASFLDLGELKQAESIFSELVRKHAWHPQALYNKTLLDWRTGKITDLEATHQVESLTNLRPNDAASWYALAMIQRERGNVEDSRHAMQRVIDFEPKKEYQRHDTATTGLLDQNTRCIERFRICPLEQPFVFLSEEEDLILFAVTPEVIGVYDTGTGGVYTRFRKNRIGTATITDMELLFAQKPISGKRDVPSQHGLEEQSGLLHEMLYADKTFSVLSDDTNWELYCGSEPGLFFLRKTHEDAQPVMFRIVRWNVNEEHFQRLVSDADAPDVIPAVRIDGGVPYVVTAKAVESDELSGHPALLLKTRGRLHGHDGLVLSAHTTPDGSFAVTGGNDKSVRIWELDSRRCVRSFLGGEGYIHSVYVSKNRKFVLSLADQALLKIWDTHLLLNEPHKLRAPIMLCLVASSEVVSQNQSELAETCRQVETLAATGDIGGAIACLEKAKTISGWETQKKELDIWELVGRFSWRQRVEEALCYETWSDHGDLVSSAAMSIDGQTAATSGRDPGILIWDLTGACCVRKLTGHSDWVRSIDLTSDGRFVVSASWDQTIRLWNVDKGELIRTFDERLKSVCCVAFSPSARTVAVATAAGNLHLFDPTNGKTTAVWTAHPEAVNTLRFSRDGRHLVTGGDDGKVIVWDVAERGRVSQTVAGLPTPVMAVWPSTTLSHVAVASRDGLVRICTVGNSPDTSPREFRGHLAAVNSLIMTPDDR